MPFAHLGYIDNASQVVLTEWRGESANAPSAGTGRTAINITALVTGMCQAIGKRWNGATLDAVPAARWIRPGEFFARFTDAEYQNLDDYLDAGSVGYKQIRIFIRRTKDAELIDLDHADVTTFLTFLVSKSILTAPRATAIKG